MKQPAGRHARAEVSWAISGPGDRLPEWFGKLDQAAIDRINLAFAAGGLLRERGVEEALMHYSTDSPRRPLTNYIHQGYESKARCDAAEAFLVAIVEELSRCGVAEREIATAVKDNLDAAASGLELKEGQVRVLRAAAEVARMKIKIRPARDAASAPHELTRPRSAHKSAKATRAEPRRSWFKATGKTELEIEDLGGPSFKTIKKWLAGELNKQTINTRTKLARACSCDPKQVPD